MRAALRLSPLLLLLACPKAPPVAEPICESVDQSQVVLQRIEPPDGSDDERIVSDTELRAAQSSELRAAAVRAEVDPVRNDREPSLDALAGSQRGVRRVRGDGDERIET